MANNTRGRMMSIPADHDALGRPELRDQQGPPTGETTFRQIGPQTTARDITKSSPARKSGDLKYSPNL